MEFLNIFSSSVCRMLFLVCSASQRYIISSLETLKPVVTSFKFFGLFLSVAHLDFLHVRFNPQLGDFTSFRSPELELSDKKLCSARISLTIFGLFANHLLCRDSLTPPVLALRLLSDISTNILSLALFHFITRHLLICFTSATFFHLFLELLKESRRSRVFYLNSTVYDLWVALPQRLSGISFAGRKLSSRLCRILFPLKGKEERKSIFKGMSTSVMPLQMKTYNICFVVYKMFVLLMFVLMML